MKETAYILQNATENSLIIMDEVGRGTSTKDGISLALAIVDHVSAVNKSMCLFASHYGELGYLIPERGIKNVAFYKAAASVDADNAMACLYQVVPGIMDRSHGIQVAKTAGIPDYVITAANTIYGQLEEKEAIQMQQKQSMHA